MDLHKIVEELVDPASRTPLGTVSDAEAAELIDLAYLRFLDAYLEQYGQRSPRERRALAMIEVEGLSYKEAAARLGIRLANLKMMIFRARQKILRGIERTFVFVQTLGLDRVELPLQVLDEWL